MIDPISVEAMLNQTPQLHFPVELIITVEDIYGKPTGEKKIVVVCGCDTRESLPVGHVGSDENFDGPDWNQITGDPRSEIW